MKITANSGASPSPEDEAPKTAPPMVRPKPEKGDGSGSGGACCVREPPCEVAATKSRAKSRIGPSPFRSCCTEILPSFHRYPKKYSVDPKGVSDAARTPYAAGDRSPGAAVEAAPTAGECPADRTVSSPRTTVGGG